MWEPAGGGGPEKGLSAQLVLSNLPLFGFGDAEEALWQTLLELVHNALDSLKSGGAGSSPSPSLLTSSPSLKISLNVEREDAQCMQVCVYDAGTGISSLSSSLQCFYSTKALQPGAPLSVGRFGVGLTACLLNSHAKTGRDMTIVTKTVASRMAAIVRFGYDRASGGPVLRQYEEHDMSGFEGTRIQVELPRLPEDSSLVRVVRAVELFLTRLHALPSTTVSTVFTVTNEGVSSERTGTPMKKTTPAVLASEEGYANAIKGAMQLPAPNESWAAATSFLCTGDDSLTIRASAVLYTTVAIDDELKEWDGALEVDLWRCFNGVPVLRVSRDFEACAITAALQSMKWGLFGLKVKKTVVVEGPHDGVEMPLGWVLQSTSRELPKRVRNCPIQLVVVLDLGGSSLPYSNLRKTALLDAPGLTRLVQNAVTAAMQTLQQHPDLDECLFLSTKEEKRLEIWNHSIPRVATALTRMLRLSPNLHEYFAGKLDLPNHVGSYASCTDFLQEVLMEAYPRCVEGGDEDDEEEEQEEEEGGEGADGEQDSELL